MDSDKYLEGQSMQRPPLFESDSFIYWKNRFKTYVKSKDLDLWHVITNGDFQPIVQNPETKLDEVIPFEKQTDDLKRKLAKNNEAKMVIYNALPRKEYERIFMCNTAKEIWKTLLRKNLVMKSVRLRIVEDEEYAMAVRDFKKFFKRRDAEAPNSYIGDCPKATERQEPKKPFVGGAWSDSGEKDDCNGSQVETVKESLNVTFDETPPPSKTSPLVDDDLDEEEAIKVTEKKNLENDIVDETLEVDEIINIKESRNHPLENVIGNLNQRTLRSQAQNQSNFFCFISTIEPKNVNEALGDESWIVSMQEELNQFVANDVWELVPQPRNMTIIGTKWVFRNKLDENGIVYRNKTRLVAQGYNQQEGIDYDETYAPVARLESIRILLAYACALDFKLFQMGMVDNTLITKKKV
ncbi:retrovirus-related pol polyprotein from transposon TNT 1-94 [Tanacetum coccineum]|uniref:Retrovirus-related pol polyprotein from transposon TNT 1-94 n=1 Tax=Tanacetum coccineum TaxID=301880 RepID=A0ABQ5BUN9_9ASTR